MADAFQVIAKGRWTDGSGETRNIFYMQPVGTPTQAIPQLALAWVENMWANITPILSSGWTLYSVETRHYSGLDGWVFMGEVAATVAGTQLADPMPHQIAPLVIGRVDAKRKQARKYIAGVTEEMVTDGRLTTLAKQSLAGFLTSWTASDDVGVDGDSVQGGVCHWAGITVTFYPIVGGRVDDVVATQRRRKPSVGI